MDSQGGDKVEYDNYSSSYKHGVMVIYNECTHILISLVHELINCGALLSSWVGTCLNANYFK